MGAGPNGKDIGVIPSRKTDQIAAGSSISFDKGPASAPVRLPNEALRRRIAATRGQPDSSPLFQTAAGKPLRTGAVKAFLRRAASAAGHPKADEFTLHSCKSGALELMYMAGYQNEFIRRYIFWKTDMMDEYMRANVHTMTHPAPGARPDQNKVVAEIVRAAIGAGAIHSGALPGTTPHPACAAGGGSAPARHRSACAGHAGPVMVGGEQGSVPDLGPPQGWPSDPNT
jgi:hypothetical protein